MDVHTRSREKLSLISPHGSPNADSDFDIWSDYSDEEESCFGYLWDNRLLSVLVALPVLAGAVYLLRLHARQYDVPYGYCHEIFVPASTLMTGSNLDDWVKRSVAQMTFEEKSSLLNGVGYGTGFGASNTWTSAPGFYVGSTLAVPRLGIPSLRMQDAAQGFRTLDQRQLGQVTAWPCSLAIAAGWDPEATERWATAMGNEFKSKGANVALGPSVNVHRVAANGRNAEYLSGEDPHLGAPLVAAYVKGMQERAGVAAVVKHFVLNQQETHRSRSSDGKVKAVDAHASERTLWELYYPPFQAAVDAGVAAVMCSYNWVNGRQACANAQTLNDDLKGVMGFKGWVMSDWWAMESGDAAIGGTDQDMPGDDGYFSGNTLKALPEGRLDDMVMRVLQGMVHAGIWPVETTEGCRIPCDCESLLYRTNATNSEHVALARELAAGSAVLLKNDDFHPDASDFRRRLGIGDNTFLFYEPSARQSSAPSNSSITPKSHIFFGMQDQLGTLQNSSNTSTSSAPDGYQSSTLLHTAPVGEGREQRRVLPLRAGQTVAVLGSACDQRKDPEKMLANWMEGDYYVVGGSGRVLSTNSVSVLQALRSRGTVALQVSISDNIEAAEDQLRGADVAIVCGGATTTESVDRKNLRLDQDEFIKSLLDLSSVASIPVVVIAFLPGAIVMPWRNDASAVLAMFLSGQETGNAAVDILLGDVNPSGKLPVTLPAREVDALPPCTVNPCVYAEGRRGGWHIYDGRDGEQMDVAYFFGHGMSYTAFEYSVVSDWSDMEPRTLTIGVKNVGGVAGREVAQLYVGFPVNEVLPVCTPEMDKSDCKGVPDLVLRGYKKTPLLQPGELYKIVFELKAKDLSVWSPEKRAWRLANGRFETMIGTSSREKRLCGHIETDRSAMPFGAMRPCR